jgi:hypothetical protein
MKLLAADLIADDTFNIACVIACVLLIIAAVMAVLERAWTFALLAAGLAVFAFAWVVVS